MAKNSSVSIFWTVLNIAVGALLAVGGIWALQGGGDFAADALRQIFSGDARKLVVLVFGVVELLSGIFIILQLFIGDRMGKLGSILKLVIVVICNALDCSLRAFSHTRLVFRFQTIKKSTRFFPWTFFDPNAI